MKKINIILIIFITLTIFLLISTNCNNTQTTNTDIQGSWALVNSTGGNLHDICPGETVVFQVNGVAVLVCPNQQAINRNYTVSGNILTFTDTGVQYTVDLSNNNTVLDLTGMGSVSGRILEYDQLSTSNDKTNVKQDPTKTKNVSEGK